MANSYGSSTFARPPSAPQYQYHSPDGTAKWKGPKRVCIFCTTAIILPSLLISVPLLMRFVIYGTNSYVLHPSDMRILDQRISTTWCEAETVTVNTSFTAYLTYGEPKTIEKPTSLTYDEPMRIPDDQKEYWGFYLLPGSTFTIKTCARFKGGTLLIVRGNNHMQYCAYVGENDSAGNSDEVSGSKSFEMQGNLPGRPPEGVQGQSHSKENGQDDKTILSRLKTFLQSNPNSRGKIQRTLEDWMLLNSTKENSKEFGEASSSNHSNEAPESSFIELATESLKEGNVDHGTIRLRRQAVEIRTDTESGENGAFEDESVDANNSTGETDFILPHKGKNYNASIFNILNPPQTSSSIWKEQHNQHSGVLNSSITGEDGSSSESESSFSSSEEALLKCQGIITSFRIPHEAACKEEGTFESLTLSKPIPGSETNSFRYEVQERDYYYFIFGSENEKETNSIRAKFELEKMEYQLPEPLPDCKGVQECQISLGFASSEKVIVELPKPLPEANSNVVYVAETACKPRSHLYLIFVILVPIVILLFAFK